MEKSFLNQEQESTPSTWEKTISKLRYAGQLLVAVTVLSGLYEFLKGDRILVKADVNAESMVESLPDSIQTLLEKAAKDLNGHIVPQIILPGGDIIIELAQQHSVTYLDSHKHQGFTDENTTIQCQKKIYTFTEDVLDISQNADIEPIFLDEGRCFTSTEESAELDQSAIELYRDLVKQENFELTLENRFGLLSETASPDFAEMIRYNMFTRLLSLAQKDLTLGTISKGRLITVLQKRLTEINMNILYHGGGMDQFARTHPDVCVQKTENAELLLEGLIKVQSGNMGHEDMIESMEKREDAVIKNIQELSSLSDEENAKRKVFILPFGAEHDFYNNLKGKGISLIRVNFSKHKDEVIR